MEKSSYTSASVFPVKLLQDQVVTEIARDGIIRPIHLQLNPTNKCNLKCDFCSCKNKDDHEMPIEQALDILQRYSKLGVKAVTITGGGDPLCYPHINRLIDACRHFGHSGMEVGLVTNGILLDTLDKDLHLKWCRISVDGTHLLSKEALRKIQDMPQVDWALSYVLYPKRYSNLPTAIMLANELDMTHIRVVDDILSKEDSLIEPAKELMYKYPSIDTDKVIWQGRKESTRGCKKCRIGLIKPNIDPHGNVYPCCGIQYSKNKPDLNFHYDFSLGHDYEDIVYSQKIFDGSKCDRCYYCQYNQLLGSMIEARGCDHRWFV